MFTKSRRTVTLFAITTAACLCCLTLAQADHKGKPHGKPGDDGGTGGDCGGGTIYYVEKEFGAATMDCDGTAKTLLPANVFGEPSIDTHGGHRWFLDLRPIPGDTYPDGRQRVELFAVRGDGNENFTIQLTNDPHLEPHAGADHIGRWVAADSEIAWVALRWDDLTGLLVDSGIYVIPIQFHADGYILPPVVPSLVVEEGVNIPDGGAPQSDIFNFDFAPDGTEIVYEEIGTGLIVVDLGTGQSIQITNEGSDPNWSPDGTKIAFELHGTSGRKLFSSIETISPDGSDGKTVASVEFRDGYKNINRPNWSPTGSHLVFNYAEISKRNGTLLQEIYRVEAAGGPATLLTGDIGNSFPVAWR